MKKLLIISLFLVSLLTLFANGPGVPHLAIFDLQTEAGGYHEPGTIGFMVEEFHSNPYLDPIFEDMFEVRKQLYWNWPDHEDQNTGNTVYASPTDEYTPGRIGIQMATLSHWGGPVHARFWFIDAAGNQIGPINLAKAPGPDTTYPDVISWGGPVAPAFPDWAINPTPATGALGVAIDVDLTWAYEGEVIPDGYEIVINDEEAVDLGDVLTYTPEVDFDYATLYTWGIMPYVNDAEPARGLRAARSKIYPEGEMPEWTFTTMDEPIPPLLWATDPMPEDGAVVEQSIGSVSWSYAADVPVDGFEVTFNGEEYDVTELELPFTTGLEYGTLYTWSVKPYRENATPIRGMRTGERALRTEEVVREYPAGDMPIWTFTTMPEPIPPLLWATDPMPADGAMGVEIHGTSLEWQYDESVPVDGFEVIFNGEQPFDVIAGGMSSVLSTLNYDTLYEWAVKPYREPAAPIRGLRAGGREEAIREYPAGDMPIWTFTTVAAPIPAPSLATLVSPEDGAEGVALDEQLMWSYEGAYIDGFEVVFNGADAVDVLVSVGEEETYSFDPGSLAPLTEYTWTVRPYRVDADPVRGMRAISSRIYPDAAIMTWTFTTTNEADFSVGETEIVIVVPDGGSANAPVPGDDLNPGDPIGDNTVPAGLVYVRFTIDQLPGAYTFRFTLNYASVVVLINNIPYNDYTYTGGVLSLNYAFTGAKASIDLIVYDESTLPVELSSFTAVAFASEYVTLNWVTESESNLHGYNIFRAENNNLSSAMRINASVVVANNQAVTSTYTYRDNEVESTTYYYWLEVSELSNENTFHGPIVVTVEDDPVIPGVTATEFRNFGPSPFSETTSTSLRVKEGETASITIYNLLGQVVARESFNAGEHNFVFNGRDSNGKKVANGIYFVRMTSPTTAKNFKIIKMQ